MKSPSRFQDGSLMGVRGEGGWGVRESEGWGSKGKGGEWVMRGE